MKVKNDVKRVDDAKIGDVNGVGRNIRVNVVAPRPVWTPLIPFLFHEHEVEKFKSNIPMGRPTQSVKLAWRI